jgi:hypothetical protein
VAKWLRVLTSKIWLPEFESRWGKYFLFINFLSVFGLPFGEPIRLRGGVRRHRPPLAEHVSQPLNGFHSNSVFLAPPGNTPTCIFHFRDLTYFKRNTEFFGANMFLTILFTRNQERSCVLYIWQAELSHVGFLEEKVLINITRWGYVPKCNWQAGNRFELFA